MKTRILLSALLVLPQVLDAADPNPKDEVAAAAAKLADKASYSWTTKVTVPEGAQFPGGTIEGETEKAGLTHIAMSFGGNTSQAVMQGSKAAVSGPDGGWQSISEIESAEGPARFLARVIRNFKAPSAQATELAAATKELKLNDGTYSGDLTEAGAKAQFRFGTVNNPKGWVKFWVKDGVLTKYEFKVQGKVEFNGNESEIERTTSVEIKKIDATKVEVPEDARKKL